MGIFGNSSPFDADIEKATSENNTTDQWGLIMEICDRVGSSTTNSKECLKAIMRRLAHNDPHVVIQAIKLLDACVNNCGKSFHLEVASRDFENEFRRLHSRSQAAVAKRLAGLIKKWAENDFKTDPQLNLISDLYHKLKTEGIEFADPIVNPNAAAQSKPVALSKDPNVVQSQQEEDDIAKAIELSLKDKGGVSPLKQSISATASSSSSAKASSSLYPSMSLGATSAASAANEPSLEAARKVRALYDFEAAEDNELIFMAGEIIHVTDDTDPNWWKGYNQRGDGLFPASFVTADLSVEPESMRLDLSSANGKSKKSVQFADDFKKENDEKAQELLPPATAEISEEKLDRLLHLLHEANPEDPTQDSAEMLHLEGVVNQMGPLIDAELERVDRTHAQLTQLSAGLVDAFNLYHTLMRESEKPPHHLYGMGYNPQAMYVGLPMSPHHHMGGMASGLTYQQQAGMPPMGGPLPYHHHPQEMMPRNMYSQQAPHPGMPPYMPGMMPHQLAFQQLAIQPPHSESMNNGVMTHSSQQHQQQATVGQSHSNAGPLQSGGHQQLMQPPHMGAFQPPMQVNANVAGSQQPSQPPMSIPTQQSHVMGGINVVPMPPPNTTIANNQGGTQHHQQQQHHQQLPQTNTNNSVPGPIMNTGQQQPPLPGGFVVSSQQQQQQQQQPPPSGYMAVHQNQSQFPGMAGGVPNLHQYQSHAPRQFDQQQHASNGNSPQHVQMQHAGIPTGISSNHIPNSNNNSSNTLNHQNAMGHFNPMMTMNVQQGPPPAPLVQSNASSLTSTLMHHGAVPATGGDVHIPGYQQR